MNPNEFAKLLGRTLSGPLPAARVQREFEPPLSFGRHFGPAPQNARQAGVLALLYLDEGTWRVPLTVRPSTLRHHAGQISFPGGGVEPGETTQECSRREFAEELGVEVETRLLVGQLSPVYVWASNYVITPYAAVLPYRPCFIPNPLEVMEILEVPLEHLRKPRTRGQQRICCNGVWMSPPYFSWNRRHIWGATAMILAEILALVQEPANACTEPR